MVMVVKVACRGKEKIRECRGREIERDPCGSERKREMERESERGRG